MKKSARRSGQRRRRKARSQPSSPLAPDVSRGLESLNALKPETTRAAAVIELLRCWLADKSGYDEEAWPDLKKALDQERRRVGARRLFGE